MENKVKDKILILSATFGDGHKQVANAIGEAIEMTLPNAEPVILDVMKWIHPHLYPISNYVYKQSIKKFPQLYSFFYQKTRVKSTFSVKLNALLSMGMKALLDMIEKTKPAVVVSTYPFAAGVMSNLKEQGYVDIPSVTIITDYTDHSYWIHPYTDQYVVGSKQVRDRLVGHGIPGDKITFTGIPIRQKFHQIHHRGKLAQKYGLSDKKFTLLIMGGGDGFFGKGLSTFHALENLQESIQVIVVCGRNHKLQKQLREVEHFFKHKFLTLGYWENVHELMAISDLMISKPGGVTITEAMAMDLPICLYRPLPGQEEDNARYLVESGLAILAKSDENLINKIQVILEDRRPLDYMKQRSKKFQSKTSTIDAVVAIVQTINRCKNELYPLLGLQESI
ncbi:MGDG synthase family glycosyltransferase [Neobacillus niacini]|uniref:MGDG synthase family glycosyltransferase n=1 Tax=Neobacillus niacini TaxID=86668 RepID=UPI00285C5CA0|nr:glycosyltransferase [Neobacillus niacini]MDR7001867.1 processive 1,2-diacylglycerol beta-glucosyltransferase [Neobacillus niacini]